MSSLAEEIEEEARRLGDPEKERQLKRYFREPIKAYGLTTTQSKALAKKYYPKVKGDLDAAMSLAETLLKTGNLTLAGVGLGILDRFRRKFGPQHLDTFDHWVDHLTNWATTDTLATHMIAASVSGDPSQVERLMMWAGSGNRWRRRAAAVSLVPLARKGLLPEEVFSLSDRLMEDEDDMVQKGVGWLLKEASKRHPEEVREYLLRWRDRAPALVLRYASEKLPQDRRVLKTRA
ncbi:MAG: DNA alkylation repair protein [Candidatus Bathyarchaeota archaeon]